MFGILRRFLQKKPLILDPATATILEAMKRRVRPTIVLDGTVGRTVLRLGGSPRLPSSDMWPYRKDRPLAFLAELDLGALHTCGGPDYLPSEGFVHVFYDAEEQPWGFDPKDRGGVVLIFSRGVAEMQSDPPKGLTDAYIFRARLLKGRSGISYPTTERLKQQAVSLDHDFDAIEALRHRDLGQMPEHRIGGYPSPVQNDSMELEAERASGGVYMGDASGYSDIDGSIEKVARSKWTLLLQIDSDDDAGMMWGDSGMLYIWVREDEARKGDFGGAWCILQCC